MPQLTWYFIISASNKQIRMSEKMVKITITIEKGLEKKLRLIQAKLIKESVASVSFSKATNYVISQGIRNLKLEIKAD